MATLSKSNLYSQSNLQAYGWREFCAEFLYGMVAITWYLLFLAEKTTLTGLTRLEKLATPPLDDHSGYERVSKIFFQDEGF